MCKIVAFTNTTKLDPKAPAVIGKIINAIEKDGYGYAVTGTDGVYGEKSVFPRFKSRLKSKNIVGLPIVHKKHEVFGTYGPMRGAGIFHGRTSTNDRGILNCHPMQRDGWNLIHNGVVTDHGPDYEKFTTNDSEDVLKRLIDGIGEVERYLSGYYAFAAIAPDGRLHIGRDSMATLFFAFSAVKDTYVFATTESLLRSVNTALGLKIGPIEQLLDDVYCIFQGNSLVQNQRIKPLGYTYRETKYAAASLGRTIETNGNVKDASLDGTLEGWPEDKKALATPAKFKLGSTSRRSDAAAFGAVDEDAYYVYRHELDNMDGSYEIWTDDGTQLQLAEFRRLSWREQERCTIQRPDGTWVALDLEDEELSYG